ncbi:MAG: hypothetical protein KDD64_03265 [Bdellovibrionales bacterium]|nr:hypothetical protein [Bdellovibrionales bacterium]
MHQPSQGQGDQPSIQKLFGTQFRSVHHALHNAEISVSLEGVVDFRPNESTIDDLEISLELREGADGDILVLTVEPKDPAVREGLVYDLGDLEIEMHRVTTAEQVPIEGVIHENFPNQMRFTKWLRDEKYIFSFPGGGDIRVYRPEDAPAPARARAVPELVVVSGPRVDRSREKELIAAC